MSMFRVKARTIFLAQYPATIWATEKKYLVEEGNCCLMSVKQKVKHAFECFIIGHREASS